MTNMRTRTKIICTIGPSVSSYEKILELIDAGMNVARLNFQPWHPRRASEDHSEPQTRPAQRKKSPSPSCSTPKGPKSGSANQAASSSRPDRKRWLLVQRGTDRSETHPRLPRNRPQTPSINGPDVIVLFDDGYIASRSASKMSRNGVVVQIRQRRTDQELEKGSISPMSTSSCLP